MAEVLVRHLDETVIDQLKARARENGRSLQAEVKLILEEAARRHSAPSARATHRALADEVRRRIGPGPHSDSVELLAEDRDR